MVRLTPNHAVNASQVSQVILFSDGIDMVCRVVFIDGTSWDIHGEYAEHAWAGWSTFWKGVRPVPVQVRVPEIIIQKLKPV